MNLPDLEILDYSALKQLLSQLADSPCGILWIERLQPYGNQAEINREFETVRECLHLLDLGLGFNFKGLTRSEEIFEKLRIEDLALSPAEILEVLNQLNHIQSTKNLLYPLDQEAPRLAAIGRNLADLSDLINSLQGKISTEGHLEDNASARLKKIRNEMIRVRNRLYRSLEGMLKRLQSEHTIQDDVITIRNERFVIPVRVECRKELAGVVHGTSSSGATLFLEPLEILDLNNEFVGLRDQEQEEIQKVLHQLTQCIRQRLEELRSAVEQQGYLDFVSAKTRFSRRFQAVIPVINEEGMLRIDNGRHPILEMALKDKSNRVVPITVNLNSSSRILVISGPNTGGKTVALKTVGLLTLMALSAIPVPATTANICVLKQVFADIGDRQSISENLSTFSSHLLNIRGILKQVCAPALVLLDELGTGTDPAEGSALGVAIVECLREDGVITIVTTHHNGLKMYAATTSGVSNACMEFDPKTLRPTYHLIQGIPGNSSGIDIAENLGLDPSLIAHARRLISDKERQLAQYAQHLMEEMNRSSRIGSSLQKERDQLEIAKKTLEAEHREIEEQRRRELEMIKERAVAKFEKEARQLLVDIQDKYLAVRARRELETKSSKMRRNLESELESCHEPRPSAPGSCTRTLLAETPPSIQAGDKVRVARYGQQGVVLAAAGNAKWEVVIGNFKCLLDPSEMELLDSANKSSTRQPVADPHVRLNLQSQELSSNEINVIGCTVDEAIQRVDKFLDNAFLSSIPEVRLIHGSGMGVLRRALSEWLPHQPYVNEVHPATASQGGTGVTIVALKI
jgi:DNA mismatch repair protein MutS2